MISRFFVLILKNTGFFTYAGMTTTHFYSSFIREYIWQDYRKYSCHDSQVFAFNLKISLLKSWHE
jgi:hypothetical protein